MVGEDDTIINNFCSDVVSRAMTLEIREGRGCGPGIFDFFFIGETFTLISVVQILYTV